MMSRRLIYDLQVGSWGKICVERVFCVELSRANPSGVGPLGEYSIVGRLGLACWLHTDASRRLVVKKLSYSIVGNSQLT
jgi:hypothetical protein